MIFYHIYLKRILNYNNPQFILFSELEVDYVHFGSGVTYYTTVMACNTAGFCVVATSDGVVMDNSPPSMGVVSDGTALEDIEYQSIRFASFFSLLKTFIYQNITLAADHEVYTTIPIAEIS
jgi:hypothetical protein